MTEEQNIDLRHAKARAWYAKIISSEKGWERWQTIASDKLGFIQCGGKVRGSSLNASKAHTLHDNIVGVLLAFDMHISLHRCLH
jgi:hypothetical protein